jgi:hypothetical protein
MSKTDLLAEVQHNPNVMKTAFSQTISESPMQSGEAPHVMPHAPNNRSHSALQIWQIVADLVPDEQRRQEHSLAAQTDQMEEESDLDRVDPGAIFGLGGSNNQTHFLTESGAGHIMHMFRNLSRFTIGGSICSGRVFLLCAGCGARTATA